MKFVGILFIISGIIVIAFIVFTVLNKPEENLAPIPDNEDIRIIYLTPSP
jgi:hypothetical protein